MQRWGLFSRLSGGFHGWCVCVQKPGETPSGKWEGEREIARRTLSTRARCAINPGLCSVGWRLVSMRSPSMSMRYTILPLPRELAACPGLGLPPPLPDSSVFARAARCRWGSRDQGQGKQIKHGQVGCTPPLGTCPEAAPGVPLGTCLSLVDHARDGLGKVGQARARGGWPARTRCAESCFRKTMMPRSSSTATAPGCSSGPRSTISRSAVTFQGVTCHHIKHGASYSANHEAKATSGS